VFLILLGGVRPAAAQSRPAFDVASVKVAEIPQHGVIRVGLTGNAAHGMFQCSYCSLESLVSQAWSIKAYQIIGPEWLISVSVNIDAKLPPGTPNDQVLLMLQTLLEERFHLALHPEQKEIPVFALEVDDKGARLHPADPAGRGSIRQGPGTWTATKTTMVGLTNMLTRQFNRTVLDKTGLQGQYDIDLHWAPDPNDTALPDLPGAVRSQLGLRLKSQKESMAVMVIDHLDKAPTEN